MPNRTHCDPTDTGMPAVASGYGAVNLGCWDAGMERAMKQIALPENEEWVSRHIQVRDLRLARPELNSRIQSAYGVTVSRIPISRLS